jgi:hypothetical protein
LLSTLLPSTFSPSISNVRCKMGVFGCVDRTTEGKQLREEDSGKDGSSVPPM